MLQTGDTAVHLTLLPLRHFIYLSLWTRRVIFYSKRNQTAPLLDESRGSLKSQQRLLLSLGHFQSSLADISVQQEARYRLTHFYSARPPAPERTTIFCFRFLFPSISLLHLLLLVGGIFESGVRFAPAVSGNNPSIPSSFHSDGEFGSKIKREESRKKNKSDHQMAVC